MADYTTQLQEIVRASNRPTTSPWLIAMASTALGFILGIVSQHLGTRLTDRHQLHKMRRLLYKDLADMFLLVDDEEECASTRDWQHSQIKEHLNFRSEKYMIDNPELYVHLEEHGAADALYSRFHRIVDEPNSFSTNVSLTLRFFANAVHERHLKRERFEQFLDKTLAEALLKRVDHHRQVDEALRRRIEARFAREADQTE